MGADDGMRGCEEAGMAEADPLASNDTVEGKAQNRRVAVNILVSKGLDGL